MEKGKRGRDEEYDVDEDDFSDKIFEHDDKLYCLVCYPSFKDQGFDESALKKKGRISCGVFTSDTIARVLRRHFATHQAGDQEEKKEAKSTSSEASPTPRQTKLSDFFSSTDSVSRRDIAAFFAEGKLAYNFAESAGRKVLGPIFKKLGLTCDRRCVKFLMSQEAGRIRQQIVDCLSGKTVVLAIDGGTVNRKPFINFCVGCVGEVYFWASEPVERMDAETISKLVLKWVNWFNDKKIYVVAVVADNASAMKKAARSLYEDKPREDSDEEEQLAEKEGKYDEDVEEAVMDLGVEVEPVDLPEVNVPQERFCVYVPCWAHSLQLLLQDVQRLQLFATAFAAVSRVVPLLLRRPVAQSLRSLLRSRDSKIQSIVVPAQTRWNSFVKAMVRISNIGHEVINMVLPISAGGLTDKEAYAINMSIVFLMPICWATDIVQADDCTMTVGRQAVDRILSHLELLKQINFQDLQLRNDVADCLSTVQSAVKKRAKHFQNRIVELLDFLSPASGACLDSEVVADDIEQYWIDRGVLNETTSRAAVESTLAMFSLRTDEEKKMEPGKYWRAKALKHPAVATFFVELEGVLVSEGSVERSFWLQCRTFRPDRCRLGVTEMNDTMMVAAVASAARSSKHSKRKPNLLSVEEWRERVFALCAPVAGDRMVTRFAKRAEAALHLKCGDRVRIAWNVSGGTQWYTGTVVERDKEGKYKVWYDEEKKVRPFNPIDRDSDWEFINPENEK
jgi:hypothetical protein